LEAVKEVLESPVVDLQDGVGPPDHHLRGQAQEAGPYNVGREEIPGKHGADLQNSD